MSSKFSQPFEIAEAIHSAAIRLLRIVRVEDTRAGIAPAQLSALSVLVFHGPVTLGQLAAVEQVKPPTMSRIIQSLVQQGLVERVSQPTDRRALRLTATPRGRKLLIAGKQRRVRALAKRLEHLSETDLKDLHRTARIWSKI